MEGRDIRAARLKRQRRLIALLLSLGLGVAAGIYLHSCQQRAELNATPGR